MRTKKLRTEKNILIAFILNLFFAAVEFAGGIATCSIAIVSDAVHDAGDALSIGMSYFLEKKSKKKPDKKYTYGYARYSVLGSLITNCVLLIGAAVMMYNSINRAFKPTDIHYSGMICLAVLGVCVNLCAAFFTHGGGSLNQKAVNLHMLEDVLNWGVVLFGAVVMRFTDWAFIDIVMSVGVSIFIIIHAIMNLKEIFAVFLEKVPCNINVANIEEEIKKIDGIGDVHHIHIWSMDGRCNLATMHIVINDTINNANRQKVCTEACVIKEKVREKLSEHGIEHLTVEIESGLEHCREKYCQIDLYAKKEQGCHHGYCHC